MKLTLGNLRRIIRENLKDTPAAICRVCGGEGNVSGEYCATCAGSGKEISYECGIGRPTVPYTK